MEWIRLAAVAALMSGCAAATSDGKSPWPEGATFSPTSKADGTQPIVYASAVTVAELAYEEGQPRDPGEVRALFADGLTPSLADDAGPLAPRTYARHMSALGYYGPVGPYGPLGVIGPLGGQPWNSDLYVSGAFAWSDHSALLTESDGPLSAEGPLGARGPLNADFWSSDDPFETHFQPGGLFGVLGPVGVSGALGPLGPLGPIGAHGYVRGEGGDYLPSEGDACHDGTEPPCRTIEVEWEPEGERRVYGLVERYDEERAREMTDNDTSFMVTGAIDDETDTFELRSDEDQWVTVAVVPEYAKYPYVQAMSILGTAAGEGYEAPSGSFVPHVVTGVPVWQSYDHRASFDDFDLALEVRTGDRTHTVVSDSADHVDWIQIFVPAGTELRATVSLHRAWDTDWDDAWWGLPYRPSTPHYRLYVVGATSHGVASAELSGPYLRTLED